MRVTCATMLSNRVIHFAVAFVLQLAEADATDAWGPSFQECTPQVLIPPGGRCLSDDQCEFGECDKTYNFCRERCCTTSGGNTCSGIACWPSGLTRRTTHCGAAGASWNLFSCRLGQPDVGALKCEGNLPTASPKPPPGLCSSLKHEKRNASKSEGIQTVRMDLTDPRCGCTSDVKALWTAGAFVGHWSSSDSFVSACGGGTMNVTGNAVILTMVVHNVDYSNLTSSGALLSAFKEKIKVSVASAAGHGVTQLDVRVDIADVAAHVTAGSMPIECRDPLDRRCRSDIAFAKVTATISVQAGVSPASVQTQISSSTSLAQGVAIGLRNIAGLSGEITISNVVAAVDTVDSVSSDELVESEASVTTAAPQLRGAALNMNVGNANSGNGSSYSTGVKLGLIMFSSMVCCVLVVLTLICFRKGPKLSRVHNFSDACVTEQRLSNTPCVSHTEPQPTVAYPDTMDGHHLAPDWCAAKCSPRPSIVSNTSTRPPSPTPSTQSFRTQSTSAGTASPAPRERATPTIVSLYNGRERNECFV